MIGRLWFQAAAVLAAFSGLCAQQYAPPPPYRASEQEKQAISRRAAELETRLRGLRRVPPALLADVEVYHKAAEWILRYGEFYKPDYVAATLAMLDRGMSRAAELERGAASWEKSTGRLSRAYRSRVDGSLQPYGLVIPPSYDGSRPVRLDVILHGRAATITEATFLHTHDSAAPVPPGQDYIQLEVFGRTNNAYRWSGETDVFEAIASVRERYRIDPDRIVLRGFSMGGAGTWHIGLHYPGLWAGIEAGAGFAETRDYAKQRDLPPYQESVLHIYDARDYALNAVNLPTVGYGGEDDPQLRASTLIREELAREGYVFKPDGLNFVAEALEALFLVGPKTGHRFHPESKKTSEAFIDRYAARGRREPERIRFVTYTPRYGRAFGFSAEELETLYERAEIDARGGEVRTRNIARLRIDRTGTLKLDGQPVPGAGVFEKRNGKWAAAGPAQAAAKTPGLQGPIDDAFMDSFLCVRPTGTPRHPEMNKQAIERLARFQAEFARWLRGDVRVKDDRDVTEADIAANNLILFGDPGSNRVLARIADRLPIRWTPSEIVVGSEKYDAAAHLLAMIYPNPLRPGRYVVLNSGHTFHEAELRATNALLYPRLGDFAVIGAGGRVVRAGLFNRYWKLP